MAVNSADKTTHRVTVTLSEEKFQQLKYWAARRERSINEYLGDAIELAIRHENGDYDLPKLEIQRLNQLVDVVTTLSSNVHSLEGVVISGFDSLLGLTRGDNYLLESEDGEV